MSGVRLLLILSAVIGILDAREALAHTALGEYIQHRYSLVVSAKNIDLTVELSFNGEPARAERLVMDTNHDGVISPAERRGYLGAWERLSVDQVGLLVGRDRLNIDTLVDPVVDLEDDFGVGSHPFKVQSQFFARTPGVLVPGKPLRIESALRANAPALVSLSIASDIVPSITLEPGHGDLLPPKKYGARIFDILCPKFGCEPTPPSTNRTISGQRAPANDGRNETKSRGTKQ